MGQRNSTHSFNCSRCLSLFFDLHFINPVPPENISLHADAFHSGDYTHRKIFFLFTYRLTKASHRKYCATLSITVQSALHNQRSLLFFRELVFHINTVVQVTAFNRLAKVLDNGWSARMVGFCRRAFFCLLFLASFNDWIVTIHQLY